MDANRAINYTDVSDRKICNIRHLSVVTSVENGKCVVKNVASLFTGYALWKRIIA